MRWSDFQLRIFTRVSLPNHHKKKEDTLTAVTKLQSLLKPKLKPNGILVVVVYPGHPEGQDEHLALQAWLQDLKPHFMLINMDELIITKPLM